MRHRPQFGSGMRRGGGMAPAFDRAPSPVKETDSASTSRLQGIGLPVVRVEAEAGSEQALVTWRNAPSADQTLAAEQLLMAEYTKFSHAV